MIEHVYRRAAEARGIDAVVVATDDERIAAAVEQFGGVARMTRRTHRSGTDRIAELARELTCDVVVNVQGDLPLLEPAMIEQLIEPLRADSSLRMSTICRRIDDPADYMNPNVVKVVRDQRGEALYFSRAPIPYLRERGGARWLLFKHIGLYGYRREFLLQFAAMPPSPLEQAESLEQLRALDYGSRIRTVETEYESVEVDTPDDLERARRLLAVPAP
jgi:3-deoxy-manno-octulosonate cytidylyltransferase (CMP-KDO synthetase)